MNNNFEKHFKTKSAKKNIEIWEEIAQYPFYKSSPEDGYNYLFLIFKQLLKVPCCYLYLLNETSDKLILESSDFADVSSWRGMDSIDDDIVNHLREPDAGIKFNDEFKKFKILQDWGINLINIPLYAQNKDYIGVILAGPNKDNKINRKINQQMDAISAATATAVRTIKEFQHLREKIQLLNSRTQVSRRMLGSALEVNRFVDLLLDLALTATEAESGFVAITDNKKRTMTVRAHKNTPPGFVEKLDLAEDGGLFEWSPDMDDVLILRDYEFINQFQVKSILAVPLVEMKKLVGVFALISFDKKNYFSDFSLSVLTNFVEQIKLVLSNSKLFDEFTQRYFSTLIAMSAAYDHRSLFTAGHSQRVANTAIEIAWMMKLTPKKIEHIKDAGLIHDVGLCGVVDISAGFQADYNHPEIGANMIEVLPISEEIIDGVKTHHEWYDGWGFPQGLKGDQIPMSGRILGVAEFFTEATANSLIKHAANWERLIEELDLRSGSQFDPQVVNSLKALILQKKESAKKNQIEQCWKFKGEPENICCDCPAFKKEKKFCWSFPDVVCEKHGDAFCDNCFIFTEWLYRIKNLIDNKQIEVTNMEHSIQQTGEVTVLNLGGEIDVAAAPQLRNVFQGLIDEGKVNIVVNLKDVEFIDSSGLGIFVVAFKSAKAKGGNIKFSAAKPEVVKVIELTRLDKHFELFQTTEQAELSFK